VNGPGVRPQGTVREPFVSLVDVMPTLCEMLDVEVPFGVQGRSLWPLLAGREYPAEEFRSINVELGFGGLHYGEHELPPLHFAYDAPRFDELNSVTQSGTTKMVRMGEWKLIYDMLGNGELYHLPSDPGELDNRYHDPLCAEVRTRLLEELLTWTIRTEDDLPGGAYTPKRIARNWYAQAGTQPPASTSPAKGNQ
jgi:arylsulfatase A-like enzyme